MTKLDIIHGFDNIWVDKQNIWKTAFIPHCSLFELLVIAFGLANTLAQLHCYVDHVSGDRFNKYATAYIDDIMIYCENPKNHYAHVKKVICRFHNDSLQIAIEKYGFKTIRIKYLGPITTSHEI